MREILWADLEAIKQDKKELAKDIQDLESRANEFPNSMVLFNNIANLKMAMKQNLECEVAVRTALGI